ncbi:MAG: translation initiation factor IF-2 [Thermoprotei archaeon]|nr:MAG: translation initiation factor IF-2 [Thermoprotei archaeon]
MPESIRSPIVVVLGHVDVGKTALLDKIRGTAVMLREPGTMTQHIGASFLPWNVLEKMCGSLAKFISKKVVIPGILVIDTPGHEAFANLRRRGGSIADLALLVIDINEGFQRQTYEALEILKARKTPFIVVANKIDKIPGWKSTPGAPFIESIRKQEPYIVARFEELLYNIMNEMLSQGFRCDRYDRISDFTKTVAIVPTSALTGEGIPDLLLVLAGLAQKYMLKRLKVSVGPGKGVILEVKEERGLGTTIDVILYDGIIRHGDTIVVGGLDKPIVTKVKALLMPKPLDEMRSPEDKFMMMKEVTAAAGVKIVATGLETAVAGAPVIVVEDASKLEEVAKRVREEVSGVKKARQTIGVVVKADTLGTLEALTNYIEARGFPVRYADVGPVVKRDIMEAFIVKQSNRYYGVILAFNVKVTEEAEVEAKEYGIPIFTNNIIYRLIEDFEKWYHVEKEKEKKAILSKLILPGKIMILPGYVFRRSNPAIVGVRVLKGRIRGGYPLINEKGKRIGEIMQIQEHGKPLKEALKGAEVAISIRGNIMIGRQVKEGDILYVDVPLDHIDIILEKFKDELDEEEIKILKNIRRFKLKLSDKLTR